MNLGSGWKTYLGSIGGMVWGVAGYITGVHGIDVMMAFLTGGFSVFGLRHKMG